MRITGPFDVKVTPETVSLPNAEHGRLSLNKHYHGPLEGPSVGEMLSGGDPKSGTGGYVAMETVTATLDGRNGSFQLMHWGTMHSGGGFDVRIEVVPASGTGDLKGLTGTMKIEFGPKGEHGYVLEYELPAGE
ncbi:MAG: DUF3224 domain-containing protein [Acidobacteria bacterium]|nr:DUF3224 domain-containing protein [Acidobacteriota bacterium]